MTRIPGFGGFTTGIWLRASEAAISLVGVEVPEMLGWPLSSLSGVMVDVDVDLEKVFVKGPKWVSLSFLVSFHDMLFMEAVGGFGPVEEKMQMRPYGSCSSIV